MKQAVFAVLTTFFIALSACNSIQEGKALFESKCARCHKLELALNETRNLGEWKKITRTMARYSNGSITSAEAEKIADYLAKK